jgi:hypothetical protein
LLAGRFWQASILETQIEDLIMQTTTHFYTSGIQSRLRKTGFTIAAIMAVMMLSSPSWSASNGKFLSQQQITQRLLDSGYSKVIRMEIEDGVYEVKVKTRDGKRQKINVDPKTGKVIGRHKEGLFN